jgi:hypothetical protein
VFSKYDKCFNIDYLDLFSKLKVSEEVLQIEENTPKTTP